MPVAVCDEFVAAVDSYVASNALAAFLEGQWPKDRRRAEEATEDDCPGHVMRWLNLGSKGMWG
jgi:hypothetical protein